MKIKFILIVIAQFIFSYSFSQYIGVKARYTQTRLVDNSPEPPSRENRLILSFYEVTPAGVYIPTTLFNFDIYIYKGGLQYGSYIGGVVDSAGNNYTGYNFTAPQAVAYYNSLAANNIDCDPNLATHYIVNGHELDCGFIGVSYFDSGNELFTAPNICLPYYGWPHPYFNSPGNVNFYQPVPATAPYNLYGFSCSGNSGVIMRGVLQQDTSGSEGTTLTVRFGNIAGEINTDDKVKISWTNLTETNLEKYAIERSDDGVNFNSIGNVPPTVNNGGLADYDFSTLQIDDKNYYRVKAIENSGKYFYSAIISLTKAKEPSSFSIYPNPVTDGVLTVRLTNADKGHYILSILNEQGLAVKQRLINHPGGNIIQQADLSGLTGGIYQCQLWSTNVKFSQSILYVH